MLRTVGESFRNFSVVAMREAELRAELARVPEVVARIPTFADDISDVEGLDRDRSLPLHGARAMSTLEDLALARTALTGADLVHMERLARPGGPSPTSRSPTSCCSHRSRARRGTVSSCWPRSGR